ncbi:MAG: hypothetical protein VYC34_02930, partial [Planctomycetota bacterium]|nr:hypothetical protein [Planctomycetota bacterium]
DAAVAYAASRSEMAVLSSSRDGKARSATFSLVTIADRPATLALRQDPAADPDQPAEILAVAVVGRFGDPAREAALLRDLQRRLDQLEERGWAPIPE